MNQGFKRDSKWRTNSTKYQFLQFIWQFQIAAKSTSPDMTTVLHARPSGRFIEKQSNLRRKKLYRTNQDCNFLEGVKSWWTSVKDELCAIRCYPFLWFVFNWPASALWDSCIIGRYFSYLSFLLHDKIFKNGPSQIWGRQPLKNFTRSILASFIPIYFKQIRTIAVFYSSHGNA